MPKLCLVGDETLTIDESAKRLSEHLVIQLIESHSQKKISCLKRLSEFASEWLPAAKTTNKVDEPFCSILETREPTLKFFRTIITILSSPYCSIFQQRLKVHFSIEETELPEEEFI